MRRMQECTQLIYSTYTLARDSWWLCRAESIQAEMVKMEAMKDEAAKIRIKVIGYTPSC